MHMGVHSSVHVHQGSGGIAFQSPLRRGLAGSQGGVGTSEARRGGRAGPGSRPGPARCYTLCGEVLVDIGISAGPGAEAVLRPLRADVPQRAMTEYILAVAGQAGFGAALIDAAALSEAAPVITWPQFA